MSFQALLKKAEVQLRAQPKPQTVVKPSPREQLCGEIERFRDERLSEVKREISLHQQAPNRLRVALLFITVRDLPNELLWRLWLQEAKHLQQDVRVDVYVHSKEIDGRKGVSRGVCSDWLRERLVRDFHLQPSWASVELTKTMLGLIAEARNHAEYDHYCFVSESCVPIVSLSEFVSRLSSGEQRSSWMRYTNQSTNGYATNKQFNVLAAHLPRERVFKADQWLQLSREHVEVLFSLLLTLDNKSPSLCPVSVQQLLSSRVFTLFRDVSASDEMFFPTLLGVLGCLAPEQTTDQPKEQAIEMEKEEEKATDEHPQEEDKDNTETTAEERKEDNDSCVEERYAVQRWQCTFCDWGAEARPKSFPTFSALVGRLQQRSIQERSEGQVFARKVQLSRVFFDDQRVFDEEGSPQQRLSELMKPWFELFFAPQSEEEKGSVPKKEAEFVDQGSSDVSLRPYSVSDRRERLWEDWKKEIEDVVRYSPESVPWFSCRERRDSRGRSCSRSPRRREQQRHHRRDDSRDRKRRRSSFM